MIFAYDGRTHTIRTMAISRYDPNLYLGRVGVDHPRTAPAPPPRPETVGGKL
jgi:hypothetical protein